MALIALLTNNDDDVYCFRKELIQAILSDGHDMIISCPDGPKFELMKEMNFIHDKLYIDRRGTNPIADWKLFLHYKKLFKKYRPDVVLTYTAKPNVYGSIAARSLRIPVINNVTGFGSVLNMGGLKRAMITALFKYAYRRSACVMFQNSTNMELAQKSGMVYGECHLIPGSGIDTKRFPLQDYPEGGDGKSGPPIIFNYIGRILHDKGVDDYIEAAKRIKKDFPNTEFNMLGFIEPTEEAHYKPLLESLEKQEIINYHGSQNDVKPYIVRAHALIHPSTYGEGMSNVLLENASSGRFLITTNNPGCQETVVDGKTGFIYSGGNVDKLVERIHKFLALPNSERQLMGQKGREYVKENFSRDIVIREYISEIKKLVKYKVGYTAGVYDMFHIRHLNVLKNAKDLCDYLIVAVSTDELVQEYKHKTPIIPFENRSKIVSAIRYVDKVIPQKDMDKKAAAVANRINVMFVGDDWKGTGKWNNIQKELNEIGIDVVYLPHTDGISSSMLREILKK